MKIETLLNKARENAKKQVWLDYLDICDGNEEKTKELIKRERENGEFVKFVESETIDNIYKLIRTIRNTDLKYQTPPGGYEGRKECYENQSEIHFFKHNTL